MLILSGENDNPSALLGVPLEEEAGVIIFFG
jgi:hypothetical protein